MTKKEARDIIRERMGNDYYFLPREVEEKWVAEIMAGTFFTKPTTPQVPA